MIQQVLWKPCSAKLWEKSQGCLEDKHQVWIKVVSTPTTLSRADMGNHLMYAFPLHFSIVFDLFSTYWPTLVQSNQLISTDPKDESFGMCYVYSCPLDGHTDLYLELGIHNAHRCKVP